jgi:hypothetical protein
MGKRRKERVLRCVGGWRDGGPANIPVHPQVTRYPVLDPVLKLTPRCSLDLQRSFYLEGPVDGRTFLTRLVFQMCTCTNLAQAGFLARLAGEYLEGPSLVALSQGRSLTPASPRQLTDV